MNTCWATLLFTFGYGKHNLNVSDPFKATSETVGELLDVWCNHFGSRLVFGYASQTKLQNKSILQEETTIRTKILDLWKD